ncbi:MAG: aminopeptidase [Chloroflexota bacterium]
MPDPRIEKLAHTLVTYSVAVKPGEAVALMGDSSSLPLLREIYKQVVLAGGHCVTLLSGGSRPLSDGVVGGDDVMANFFLRHANEDQLNWISPVEQWVVNDCPVTISIRSTDNTRRGSSIDAKRISARAASRAGMSKTRFARSAEGKQRWTLAMFPTEGHAQEADMSLEEFEDFFYHACFADQPDPIQCWRDLEANQQKYVDWLKGHDRIVVRGPNADLSLSIKDRTFINSTGTHNMPSGEIFTGPVEESVNGWVRFTYPAINGGRQVDGIELKFEHGKVVSATAKKNEDYLLSMLDTDTGARFLGEWAIGTNFGINRFTGNILFDEKIGGTIHMAVGRGYPETGSKNESAIHWDMICDMRDGSEIVVDGDLFYKDGQFAI